MSNPVKELLEKAKAVFEDHGGAVGVFQEAGKVCAIGALHEAGGLFHTDAAVTHYSENLWPAQTMLQQSARSLYSMSFEDEKLMTPAVYVNDKLGQAAVLSLYDDAIKTAGDGVNP